MEFTCVFYEDTLVNAQKRLNTLRITDKYSEIKAYIIPVNGEFRVLRKVNLQTTNKKPS